jgi:hypothetical protein
MRVAAMKTVLQRVLDHLLSTQWSGNEDHTECPSCRRMDWVGHGCACRLVALIEEIQKLEEEIPHP